MPIYEYRCAKCNNEFELLIGGGASSEVVECPKCGSKKVERLFSTFSSVIKGAPGRPHLSRGSSSSGSRSCGGCTSMSCSSCS